MKIRMYIDLPDDGTIVDKDYVFASTNKMLQVPENYIRYAIEVDLPIKHFKPIADREIKAIILGSEEK